MRHLTFLLFLFFFSSVICAQDRKLELGGNAFITNVKTAKITEKGIENWTDPEEVINFYVRISKPGTVGFSLNETNEIKGKSVIEFSINNQPKRLILTEGEKTEGEIGLWEIRDTGYVKVTIKGISKTKATFAEIRSLNLKGTAIDDKTSYVKNNEGNFFYWGRRGPSVHLTYKVPEQTDVEWFYNELTVPKGNDVLGSYFMANGFLEGYFGIQVKSPTERRVLFSVWSPFKSDDPKSIPEDYKIKMLKKGKDVYTREFGREGAGAQSRLQYNWKAGNTYRFLLHGVPSGDSTTIYTAYFFAPEMNEWMLIASFKRPKTQTYLKHFHSFLENFIPEMGDKTRKVLFNNQWVCDTKGNWTELDTASFSIDNTGTVNYRKDYAGGIIDDSFYLKNAGFFNNFTPAKTIFTRKKTNQKPIIDFSKLP